MSDTPPVVQQVVWLNGSLRRLQEAAICPLDRGFHFGDGLFETLRAERGRILMLPEHIARLEGALEVLRIPLDRSIAWDAVLSELLTRNGLDRQTAAVKILVSRGIEEGLGCPPAAQPTLLAMARPYAPPSPDAYARGWRLIVHREGYAPPLARFKSLNYLYFLVARQAALDAGADEAVIVDPRGHVTEASAGSLLARTGSRWWTPASPQQLPGITLQCLTRLLTDRGCTVEQRLAAPADLHQADTIWVLNSLMGVMPVRQVDDRQVTDPAVAEAARWREEWLMAGS